MVELWWWVLVVGVEVEEREKWVGVTVGLKGSNKMSFESWAVTTFLWAQVGCFERVGRWVYMVDEFEIWSERSMRGCHTEG